MAKVELYSIAGIVAVFLVVVLALPGDATGFASLRDLFRGEAIIVGDCTTTKDTCPKEAFCNAKLIKSETSKLKGAYRGYCIKKYSSGHLCRKSFQCQSGECLGVDESGKKKFLTLQMGGCA